MYWRTEEENTIAVLFRFSKKEPDALLSFIYSDDEEYVFLFHSACEGDNQDDVDAGISAELEDFFVIGYHVIEVTKAGPHGFQTGEYIDVDYRDMPLRIITDDGVIIYPASLRKHD